jgi:hypothetical protein
MNQLQHTINLQMFLDSKTNSKLNAGTSDITSLQKARPPATFNNEPGVIYY